MPKSSKLTSSTSKASSREGGASSMMARRASSGFSSSASSSSAGTTAASSLGVTKTVGKTTALRDASGKQLSKRKTSGVGVKKEAKRTARQQQLLDRLSKAATAKDPGASGSSMAIAKPTRSVRESAIESMDTLSLTELLAAMNESTAQDSTWGGMSAQQQQGAAAAAGGASVAGRVPQPGSLNVRKMTNERRKKLGRSSREQLAAVAAHSAFQNDPFGAISQHVQNAVAMVQMQRQKLERDNAEIVRPQVNMYQDPEEDMMADAPDTPQGAGSSRSARRRRRGGKA